MVRASPAVRQALDEICAFKKKGLHPKCSINDTYDVALRLACTAACAQVLGVRLGDRRTLNGCASAVAFALILFRMAGGPASMCALLQNAKTWIAPLHKGLVRDEAVASCLTALRLSISTAIHETEPVGNMAKFLIKGIRLASRHTGLDVLLAMLDVDWGCLQTLADRAGELLPCTLSEFIANCDSFCEAGVAVFV